MRKLLIGTAVGLGMIAATAVPAAAASATSSSVASPAGWYYSGYWYNTSDECEAGFAQLIGGNITTVQHECWLDQSNVYELWLNG